MRHRADNNQKEIIEALRQIGASVLVLSQVGGGCPDLLIGFRNQSILMEVKTKKGKLKPEQIEFIYRWRGNQVQIVRSVEEAIELCSDL